MEIAEGVSVIRPPPTKWRPHHLDHYVGQCVIFSGIIGSGYYIRKGFLEHPDTAASVRSKLATGIGLARANTPRVCGVAAAAGLLFSFLEQGLYCMAGKEKSLNFGISAAISAAAVTARRGPLVASRAALGFGALGFSYHHYYLKGEMPLQQQQQQQQP